MAPLRIAQSNRFSRVSTPRGSTRGASIGSLQELAAYYKRFHPNIIKAKVEPTEYGIKVSSPNGEIKYITGVASLRNPDYLKELEVRYGIDHNPSAIDAEKFLQDKYGERIYWDKRNEEIVLEGLPIRLVGTNIIEASQIFPHFESEKVYEFIRFYLDVLNKNIGYIKICICNGEKDHISHILEDSDKFALNLHVRNTTFDALKYAFEETTVLSKTLILNHSPYFNLLYSLNSKGKINGISEFEKHLLERINLLPFFPVIQSLNGQGVEIIIDENLRRNPNPEKVYAQVKRNSSIQFFFYTIP